MLKAKCLLKLFPLWGLIQGFPELGQKWSRADNWNCVLEQPAGPRVKHHTKNKQDEFHCKTISVPPTTLISREINHSGDLLGW